MKNNTQKVVQHTVTVPSKDVRGEAGDAEKRSGKAFTLHSITHSEGKDGTV